LVLWIFLNNKKKSSLKSIPYQKNGVKNGVFIAFIKRVKTRLNQFETRLGRVFIGVFNKFVIAFINSVENGVKNGSKPN
jgi:hypothetical protein